MHIETIKTLVDNGTYRDREKTPGTWSLSSKTLCEAIYGDDLFDREAQAEAFLEAEDVQIYDLKTWVCTDTRVGLRLVEVNGEPMGITWQQGRKCPESLMFLSPECRVTFIAAWDKHAVTPNVNMNVLSLEQMSIPVAAASAPGYDMENSDYPHLSGYGADQVFDQIRDENATSTDLGLFSCADAALSRLEEQTRATIARYDVLRTKPMDHLSEEKRVNLLADIEVETEKAHNLISAIEGERRFFSQQMENASPSI